MPNGELRVASQTLDPLPTGVRQGLTAIAVLAFISFTASTTLFSYLTYKLVAWRFITRKPAVPGHAGQQSKSFQHTVDFALGIDGIFDDDNTKIVGDAAPGADPDHADVAPRIRNPPNQFLLLIYNLLLADMHQSMAFLLNVSWVAHDAIIVGSPTCVTQGFFVSTGDLASSMFITTIAVHTYLSVLKGYRTSQRVMYMAIVGIWVFVYAISAIPIAATHNGADVGGFFVRAGSWVCPLSSRLMCFTDSMQCWMNHEYENLRLVTHYLFIFLALITTSGLYITIFVSLRRQDRRNPDRSDDGSMSNLQLSHNPAFLIYPVIYVLCTLPLALGRLASMIGSEAPLPYLCFAGAMIASNGSFDCLLFGTTRNVIVFASRHEVDMADVGLKTFAFMQTPTNRRYGNIVWVQGGGRRKPEDKTTGGWWSWQRLAGQPEANHGMDGSRGVSQESLRGPAIQMDMVTSVVVEVEGDKRRDPRYPDRTASASASVNSSDKTYPRAI